MIPYYGIVDSVRTKSGYFATILVFEANTQLPNRIRSEREVALFYTLYRLASHIALVKDVQTFGKSDT